MPKNRNMNKMIGFIMALFLFTFLGITTRFLYIQVSGEVNQVSLQEWAEDIRQTEMTLSAERGKIFDENGKLLVYNRPTYRMYAILDPEFSASSDSPLHVEDIDQTARELAPYLKMDERELKNLMEKGKKEERWQIEFGKKGRHLSKQQMEEIKALQLPGINFMEDSLRYYSNGVFASHIVGFTRPNSETNELEGIIGIENEYNKVLSGEDGFVRYERDKYNQKLLHSEDVVKQSKDGHDLYLTINQKIQVLLEDVMSEVDEKYEPERMSVIVMEPSTGKILALGNRPTFNPNELSDVENWYNDAISTPVEPGSTVKMFTWAAAIDSGRYNGDELYQSGKYQVNPKIEVINDHNQGRGWGKISFDEGFRRSSNVAASKLMWEKLGSDLYYEYLKRFHFDQPTEIDLPNEKTGQILYNWPSEKLRTSFGQGSTSTPLQLLKAASAIANKGKMMRPYVVDKIVDSETGKVIEQYEPEVVDEPIKEETAEKVLSLLDDVVNKKGGTGKSFRLQDYSAIGKTGTAQIPNPEGAGYLTGKENHIFSFLGMAPKEDPQLMVHVSIKQPKLAAHEVGSDPVSYIFKNITENSLRYLDIKPDQDEVEDQIETYILPNIMDLSIDQAKKVLEDVGIDARFVGDGKKIEAINIAEDEVIFSNQKAIVITNKPTMPDISGWSKRDVYYLSEQLHLQLETSGEGFATSQSIKAGTRLTKDKKLKVEFSQ